MSIGTTGKSSSSFKGGEYSPAMGAVGFGCQGHLLSGLMVGVVICLIGRGIGSLFLGLLARSGSRGETTRKTLG